MSVDFFAGFEGIWLLTGEVMGRPIRQDVLVEQMLDGHFLRLTLLPSTISPGDEPYSAVQVIGRDGDRYHLSLFDPFTAGSGPVGVGTPDGDALAFTFDYSDGPFRTTFRRVEHGWDIEQVGARGPFATKRLRQPRLRKAWAYITDGTRLLVLRHTDQPLAWSGIQVISGTLEDDEDAAVAVLREAGEETGRDDLAILDALGEHRHHWGNSDSDVSAFRLAFTGPPPERFEHGEFTNDHPDIRFSFFWVDVRDAHLLLDHEQGEFLPELKRAMGLEVQ